MKNTKKVISNNYFIFTLTILALIILPFEGLLSLNLQAKEAKEAPHSTADIGGRTIKFELPKDQCPLNENHPSDKRLIEGVKRGIKGATTLLAGFANCQEVKHWRKGTLPTLNHFGYYQTPNNAKNIDFSGKETETIKKICEFYNKQGVQMLEDMKTEMDQRVKDGFANIKINQNKMLGVVKQTSNICVIALAQRLKTEGNAIKDQVNIYSISFLNGRMIFTYLYAPTKQKNIVKKLTDDISALNQHNQRLNNKK